MTVPAAAALALFIIVHLFVGKLRFLHGVPRSRWLSMAGGVAVAYVFLHVLPELGAHQNRVEAEAGAGLLETEIYLMALLGLVSFYGLERHVRGSRAQMRARGGEDRPEAGVFWLHIGSFSLYNLLIGYLLLHREETGIWSLAIYAVAMALHFVTNDYGLREDYKSAYDRIARWLLSGAVAAGWLLGLILTVSDIAVGLLFAFLSGGVVLNVLKEELPEERQSRFLPFLAGLTGYAALLIMAG